MENEMAFINWSELDSPAEIAQLGALIGFCVISILGWVTSFLKSEALKNYKVLTESLEARVKSVEDDLKKQQIQHNTNLQKIHHLEGQVATYKELPIKEWAESQAVVAKHMVALEKESKVKIKLLNEILKKIDT